MHKNMSLLKNFRIAPVPLSRICTSEQCILQLFRNTRKHRFDGDVALIERFLTLTAVYRCEPFHARSHVNWPQLPKTLSGNLRELACPVLLMSPDNTFCFIDVNMDTLHKRVKHFDYFGSVHSLFRFIQTYIDDWDIRRQRLGSYVTYTFADQFCSDKPSNDMLYSYSFILAVMNITPDSDNDEPPNKYGIVQRSVHDDVLGGAPVDLIGMIHWLTGEDTVLCVWKSRICISWDFCRSFTDTKGAERSSMLKSLYKHNLNRLIIKKGIVYYPIDVCVVPYVYVPRDGMLAAPDVAPGRNLQFLLQHGFVTTLLEYINGLDTMISAYIKNQNAEKHGLRRRVGVVVGKRRKIDYTSDPDEHEGENESDDDSESEDIVVYPPDELTKNLMALVQGYPVIRKRYDYIRKRIDSASTAKPGSVRGRIPPCLAQSFYTSEPFCGYLKNDLRRDIKNILEHVSHFTATPLSLLATEYDIARVRSQPRMKQKSVDAMVQDFERPRKAKYGQCSTCAQRRKIAANYVPGTLLTHVPCPVKDIEDCVPRKLYSHTVYENALTPYHVMADAPHDIHLTFF